jgi:nitroreductase
VLHKGFYERLIVEGMVYINLFDAVKNRTSYRDDYLDKPVSRKVLGQIMEAGLAAPSGCNMQTTSLIAIDEAATLSQIKRLLTLSMRSVETAPAFICVLTERVKVYQDKCFAVQDYSAAIQNMLLAIVASGCESCWIEGYVTGDDNIGRQIADVLGVPAELDLVCVLPVGYAAKPVKHVTKKLFDARARFV